MSGSEEERMILSGGVWLSWVRASVYKEATEVDMDKRQTPFNKAEDDPFNSAWYCNILVAILGGL